VGIGFPEPPLIPYGPIELDNVDIVMLAVLHLFFSPSYVYMYHKEYIAASLSFHSVNRLLQNSNQLDNRCVLTSCCD
jgi:hypothetical protein